MATFEAEVNGEKITLYNVDPNTPQDKLESMFEAEYNQQIPFWHKKVPDSPIGAAVAIFNGITGGYGAKVMSGLRDTSYGALVHDKPSYEDVAQELQEIGEKYKANNKWKAGGLELLGSLVPFGVIGKVSKGVQALTGIKAIGKMALDNAIIGGAYGTLQGTSKVDNVASKEGLQAAGKGFVEGAVGGAGIGLLGAGATKLAKGVVNAGRGLTTSGKIQNNLKYLGDITQEAIQTGKPPLALKDPSGKIVNALKETMHKGNDKTKTILNEFHTKTAENQVPIMASEIEKISKMRAPAASELIESEARKIVAPLYEEALSTGNIYTPEYTEYVTGLKNKLYNINQQIKSAQTKDAAGAFGNNGKAIIEELKAQKNELYSKLISEDVTQHPFVQSATKLAKKDFPELQGLRDSDIKVVDKAKQYIGDTVESLKNKGRKSQARARTVIQKKLGSIADQHAPKYTAAKAAYINENVEANQALKYAQDIGKSTPEEFEALKNLTTRRPELKKYQDAGIATMLGDNLTAISNEGGNVARKVVGDNTLRRMKDLGYNTEGIENLRNIMDKFGHAKDSSSHEKIPTSVLKAIGMKIAMFNRGLNALIKDEVAEQSTIMAEMLTNPDILKEYTAQVAKKNFGNEMYKLVDRVSPETIARLTTLNLMRKQEEGN